MEFGRRIKDRALVVDRDLRMFLQDGVTQSMQMLDLNKGPDRNLRSEHYYALGGVRKLGPLSNNLEMAGCHCGSRVWNWTPSKFYSR